MVDQSNYQEDFDEVRQDAEHEIRQDSQFNRDIEAVLQDDLSLEDEVGLKEVDLDEAAIDTIAADTTDDNLDDDDDGIEDNDQNEMVSDLPQEFTESYGTGLQGAPSDRAGRYSRRSNKHFYNDADATLTGGDVDANYEQASAVGDESVGGTVATPDQDVVEELAVAVGIETDDRSFLRTNDMLEERDDRRWELDPKSSEDYSDRRGEER